ncbi:MAG: hypothetical protein EAY75_06745 [Bacteroidetes bacterium]|nr:MAG: hypothetical protein EAY75_06745 [Bacteroidota bacterium]
MVLKKGKEEIIYLLNKAIEKFQQETGKEIVQNTNRKNYEGLSVALSHISNALPYTAQQLGHGHYSADPKGEKQAYPFRKYDITGGQIKDALMGLVAHPRQHMVDACYIYLYGVGRLAFEANPTDAFLIQQQNDGADKTDALSLYQENQLLRQQLGALQKTEAKQPAVKQSRLRWLAPAYMGLVALVGLCIYYYVQYSRVASEWHTIKTDFNLLPYRVTAAERQQLEGVWICYTGSPQARISDPNRFQKVVSNMVEIVYKDGYFLYNRFGASFNHSGYIQFESPGLLSIHSSVKNAQGVVESPRHSLMSFDSTGAYFSAISASWNFDVGSNNQIIGIREAYQKLGAGGQLEEVINSVENASCQCKIIRWRTPSGTVQTFYLKNIALETLQDSALSLLIDERSILPKNPSQKLLVDKAVK